MKLLASLLLTLTVFVGLASAQYGNSSYDASSSVGQNNVGYAAAPKAQTYASTGYSTYYTPTYYNRCGRRYCYYQPVTYATQTYTPQPQTTNVTNPIGAVNTDNSVTYQYTYNITHAQQPYPQGSSLLGYPGITSTADVYSNVDLAANLDTYTRAVAQSSSDASSILGRINDTFQNIASNQKELAATAIQAQAMTAMAIADVERTKAQSVLAKSLQTQTGSGVTVTQGYRVEQGSGQTRIVPDPSTTDPNIPPPPPDRTSPSPLPADNLGQIQLMFNARCVMCHSGTTPKGGLNLTNVSVLNAAQVESVLNRTTHPDPLKRMPLTAEGKPGEPLSTAELKLLFKSSK